MMDHRDDWPDGVLDGDLESVEGLDPSARERAERMVRDERNMNSVLLAMAEALSERLPTPIHGEAGPARRRTAWRWDTLVPLAAAAVIAALILVRGGETGADSESFIPPPESRAPSMVSEMDVEADGPFVVFPTSDPDIAVVWLLNPTEDE